ncbi:DEAD/DEAH box helicase family protein [Micromonospora chokoriensis]|uniref:Type I restriction enzyme, R subunit n=1 Tax=Micromonospora chokoriensis TaxID=356851 RepID=A0A1C4WNI9_9ACTN|nr:DEAD/DEAH box helicase family protein [Micromonospora chokoriensis]SCE97728.1 type I restriction enzyme, R subunit [Micromonospora chokoriensis]
MSNFAFLRAEWPELFAEAEQAELNAAVNPRTACFYARRCLEHALKWLYRADRVLREPSDKRLVGLITEPTMKNLVGPTLTAKMQIIRVKTNKAVHENGPVTAQVADQVVRELFHLTYWIARTYTRDASAIPPDALAFDPALVPHPADLRTQSRAEIRALDEQLAARDAALAEAEAANVDLDAQIAALRAQITAAKAANAARPDHHDYNEQETRDRYTDVLLGEAGWPLDQKRDREFPVSGLPRGSGNGQVDYVLWGTDDRPLAVVEAKRTRRDALVGQQQAKEYADALEATYGQRPVIFYTNGYETWLWEDDRYPPRPVQGFYTRDELQLLVQRRTSRRRLAELTIDGNIVERHYQQRAIRRIAETFEGDAQRKALVVMATGAGKTRTVIALVELLMRANWVKRVLFLADRVALVDQAARAFKEHLPHATTVKLTDDKVSEGRVYVSTYPTMLGLINQTDGGRRRFGPGHFDLVVIDEAHRSVYQKYRAIFSYFDSLLVGLTATPKDEVDRNTYGLFDLADGVPTDAYTLEEAVEEKYLVPPRAVAVDLRIQRTGLRYDELSEAEKDEWDALEWGDGDVPDEVTADEVNSKFFNADTVDKVLEYLMTRGHRVAGGDRIGKTIIFAKNNRHAKFIAERFDANYPHYRGQFARIITHQIVGAQGLIDSFSNPDRQPHIAISVDMLDTGIDVPDVINLVFFKNVRSKTKFAQMLGRGTRLRPDLYAPGVDKKDFFVFDFCGNFEYFGQNPPTTQGSLSPSLTERLFKAKVELVNQLDQRCPADAPASDAADGTHTEAGLRWDLARELHRRVRAMRLDNIVVRPHRRLVEYFVDFENWHRLSPEVSAQLATELAGLPSEVRDDGEEAKRFDLLILRLQLGLLVPDGRFNRHRTEVQEIAAALLEQTTIPAIRERVTLLDEVAGDEWWQDVTLPMLELARRRIRDLVRLVPKARRAVVYTNFADEIDQVVEMPFAGVSTGTDLDRFREKVRVYLRTHEDHLAVQKLRRNRPLSGTDLAELERMLGESGVGDKQDIDQARRASEGLGLFIRSMVGLDREAAREAFSEFLTGRALNAAQLDFINLIINDLTANGVMDPGRLYESPFNAIAPHGPEVLFPSADVDRLCAILAVVKRNAMPATEAA